MRPCQSQVAHLVIVAKLVSFSYSGILPSSFFLFSTLERFYLIRRGRVRAWWYCFVALPLTLLVDPDGVLVSCACLRVAVLTLFVRLAWRGSSLIGGVRIQTRLCPALLLVFCPVRQTDTRETSPSQVLFGSRLGGVCFGAALVLCVVSIGTSHSARRWA